MKKSTEDQIQGLQNRVEVLENEIKALKKYYDYVLMRMVDIHEDKENFHSLQYYGTAKPYPMWRHVEVSSDGQYH
jgi:hypothetical protein